MRIPSVHPSTVFHEGNTLLNHPDKKNIDIGVKGPFIIRGVIISLITSIISLMVPLLPRLSHQLSLSICSYIYSRVFHLQLTNSLLLCSSTAAAKLNRRPHHHKSILNFVRILISFFVLYCRRFFGSAPSTVSSACDPAATASDNRQR